MDNSPPTLQDQPLSAPLTDLVDDVVQYAAPGIVLNADWSRTYDEFVMPIADLLPASYDPSALPSGWEVVEEYNYEADNFIHAHLGYGGFNSVLVRNVDPIPVNDPEFGTYTIPINSYALLIAGAEVSPPDTSYADITTYFRGNAVPQYHRAIAGGLLDSIFEQVDLSSSDVDRLFIAGQSQGHALAQLIGPALALEYERRYEDLQGRDEAISKIGIYGFGGYSNGPAARGLFGDGIDDVLLQYDIDVVNTVHMGDPVFGYEIAMAMFNSDSVFDYLGGHVSLTFTDEINADPAQIPQFIYDADESLGGLIDIYKTYVRHSATGYASMVLNDHVSVELFRDLEIELPGLAALTGLSPNGLFTVPKGFEIWDYLPSLELPGFGTEAPSDFFGIGPLLDFEIDILGGDGYVLPPVDKDLSVLKIDTSIFIDPAAKDTSGSTSIQNDPSASSQANFSWIDGNVAKGVKLDPEILNKPGAIKQQQASIVSDDYRPGAAKISSGENLFGSDDSLLTGLYNPTSTTVPPIPDANWSVDKTKKFFASEFSNTVTGSKATQFIDPLIIDLDGNGVTTSSFAERLIFFDVDNDAARFKERSGWVSS